MSSDFSSPDSTPQALPTSVAAGDLPFRPRVGLGQMLQLGLFQMGLGMMSVLLFGVLNRILIKELGIPATLATVILALTLFVAPMRVLFGHLSDTRPIFGLYRTNYVRLGVVALAILAFGAVQVMWQVGASLQATGWSGPTYAWTALLAVLFAAYGVAVSASSTPFATLLVDVTDEDQRSQIVAVDWAMLIGGTIIGAITIGVMLRQITANSSLAEIQSGINRLFLVVPLVVVALAAIATAGIERKFSRFAQRVQSPDVANSEGVTSENMGLKRAWTILNSSPQTRHFFTFLIAMTMGLFLQDAILEPFGGEVFNLPAGQTAILNAFWGSGTVVGILLAGFLISPRLGKRRTAQIGCQSVVLTLVAVVFSGFTANPKVLQWTLLLFGLASGVTTTGAITLMLDLTAAEAAGTFIGAWGLSQALARGMSTVLGGVALDLGKRVTGDRVVAYGFVFLLQAAVMIVASLLLQRVNVEEFRIKSRDAIAAVIAQERD
jgi:MFS transporter, BCD family, chlorophyll transporter